MIGHAPVDTLHFVAAVSVAGGAASPSDAALRRRMQAENFPVALRMLPSGPRRHLRAVYDVARLIDTAGDEAPGDRLALLDALDDDLGRAWTGGEPAHPVLRRLVPTVRDCALPRQPFRDLIEANRWDVRGRTYPTREDLLGYCRLSAVPVGRLVLAVAGVEDDGALAASDSVCTALQLVEHWQDVAEDAAVGRIYLPERDRAAHGVTDAQLAAATASPALRRLLAAQSEWARALLAPGRGLVAGLSGWPRLAVAGYVAGGLGALDGLHRVGYDVLGHRPGVRRRDLARHAAVLLVRRRR